MQRKPVRQAKGLTERERKIARLVMAGQSNAQIATALGVSLRTVTTDLQNIYRKMHIARPVKFSKQPIRLKT